DTSESFDDVIIRNGGVLKLDSTAPTGTGIVKGGSLDNKVNITVDNGKIESYRTDGKTDTIDIHHGGDHINTKIVGTVEVSVADGVTLVTGTLTDDGKAATINKTGNGTYKTVADADLGKSILNVDAGGFIFDKNAEVADVNVKADTTLTFNEDLTVNNGGKIDGTLNGTGNLTKNGEGTLAIQGASKVGGTLDITGGKVEYGKSDNSLSAHSAGKITINSGATLDLKQNATLTATKVDVGNGTFKLGESAKLIGHTTVSDGTITARGNANIDDVAVTGNAMFDVASGAELFSQKLNGTGGAITKTGSGDYIVQDVAALGKTDIKVSAGEFRFEKDAAVKNVAVKDNASLVFGGNATVNDVNVGTKATLTLNGATDGIDIITTNAGSTINANAAQTFGYLELVNGATYHGNNSALTLNHGGTINGTMTGVSDFTTNGNLAIPVTDGSTTPVLSVKTLSVGGNAKIYFVGEGSHQNIMTTKDTDLTSLKSQFQFAQSALQTLDIQKHSVSISVDTASHYFSGQGGNAQKVGAVLDQSFNSKIGNGALQQLDAGTLNGVLQQGLAGEITANGLQTVVVRPTGEIFSHLNEVNGMDDVVGGFTRGQAPQNKGVDLWFTTFARYENAEKDGIISDGYTNTHVGMLAGADWKLYNKCLFGAAFGYGAPRIKNDTSNLNADDFSVGLYYRMPVIAQLYTNLYLGYGSQNYKLKTSGNETEYSGNSLTGSIQFMRDFYCSKLKLTPLLGFEFSTLKTDEYNVGLFRVADNKFDQARVKVGFNSEFCRFRTRLSYTTLLGGDKVSVADVSFADTGAGTRVNGINTGTDWFSVGVGGKVLERGRLKIYTDYDFDTSKHMSGHTGQLQAVLSW
ncbi:MAG: autotransporter domain-containing protein, partial [Planctomycetaceae bacterium]|nr:autotransporter domain-containing protein [Planctomycetaceae bacterium]